MVPFDAALLFVLAYTTIVLRSALTLLTVQIIPLKVVTFDKTPDTCTDEMSLKIAVPVAVPPTVAYTVADPVFVTGASVARIRMSATPDPLVV